MKNLYIIFCFALISQTINGQDTFSITAVDPETGEIGSAGATCVDGIAQWGGIQLLNKIIPGRGSVNAQAWICLNPHINLDNAIAELDGGSSPEEVIDWLFLNDQCSSQGFNPQYRQYGVVDFDDDGNPRADAFTGNQAADYKGHLVGENYAIQGNILLGAEVLEGMEAGFTGTEGSLAEKLMAAMQGANMPGADSRCLDRGTSSTSAFLRVVKPDDVFGEHYLELSILEMPFGEEPIDSLQTLFDEWQALNPTQSVANNHLAKVYPNPTSDFFTLEWKGTTLEDATIFVIDATGRELFNRPLNSGLNEFSLPEGIPSQILFVQVKDDKGAIVFADKLKVE